VKQVASKDTGFFPDLFFGPEDEGIMLLQNVCLVSMDTQHNILQDRTHHDV
jgi:hypothetical protein